MTSTDAATEGHEAAALLERTRRLVDPHLRSAVESLPGGIRRIAMYHFGWENADGTPAAGQAGKAIRPALVLAAARALGGDPERAVRAAVAVELAHNFTLLHDDVIDEDTTRRHRPTAWAVFGVPDAIITGDAMLAQSPSGCWPRTPTRPHSGHPPAPPVSSSSARASRPTAPSRSAAPTRSPWTSA
ncbi:hypothetical protein SMICM304S_02454 [Streptomyces microflavus]